jgi:HD-GYP domain-containing protein (c-di-GMP phosphodiesterase class II)
MADQFAVLAEVDDAAHAAVCAREARGAVRSSREAGISLDASVGYAICPDDALEAEALLRKADQALAWAKNHGKGGVVGHDERVARAASSDLHVAEVEQATRLELTRALLAVVDARDHSGFLHSRNVAAVTRLFGEDLGFSHDRLERLHVAALLHDVGYLAVADDRASSSAAVRRKARHEHPRLGARMVESLGIAGITEWVLSHHERWDGNGFPRGVSAEQIPLEARMITLANTYDSLVSGRRYGTPMTKRAALQEIDLGIGARFDPELAERFIALVARTEALGWGDGGSAA